MNREKDAKALKIFMSIFDMLTKNAKTFKEINTTYLHKYNTFLTDY